MCSMKTSHSLPADTRCGSVLTQAWSEAELQGTSRKATKGEQCHVGVSSHTASTAQKENKCCCHPNNTEPQGQQRGWNATDSGVALWSPVLPTSGIFNVGEKHTLFSLDHWHFESPTDR